MGPPKLAFEAEKILSGLKSFQRRTVEHVFHRLFEADDSTHRFLVADEVGLGKTLVAKGVIAKAIDHLADKVDRIDVVYVCSNADIARQNIRRLNVSGDDGFALATRITLLPTTIHGLKEKRVNFVSFTPGTSIELSGGLGIKEERALLYRLLERAWDLRGKAPSNVLRGAVRADRFRKAVAAFDGAERKIDEDLAQAFCSALEKRVAAAEEAGEEDLRSRFETLCEWYPRSDSRVPKHVAQERSSLVGELRSLLARTCIDALEPDLVILDEFQRFSHLLHGDDEASLLARALFTYADEDSSVRVLMLSATPYKMYTVDDESETENHYQDFLAVLSFLLRSDAAAEEIAGLLEDYRKALLRLSKETQNDVLALKEEIQARLSRVVARTERLAASGDGNGMLRAIRAENPRLTSDDVGDYLLLDGLAEAVEHPDPMPFWKSAPYTAQFMDKSYQLKARLVDACDEPESAARIAAAVRRGRLLTRGEIERYAELDPGNARLRALLGDTVERGAWKWLWIAPSLPYYQLQGAFEGAEQFTKRLIFSAWRVVPKAIATLLSYEVERRCQKNFDADAKNTGEAHERRGSNLLLRFRKTDGRLAGMPILTLLYPSSALAALFDPLCAPPRGEDPAMPGVSAVLAQAAERINRALQGVLPKDTDGGPPDEAWYWAAPILLDRESDPEGIRAWFGQAKLASLWAGEDEDREEDSVWAEHVARAEELLEGRLALGPPPDDLAEVLALVAVASPATAALRAFSRPDEGRSRARLAVRTAAAQVGWGFRKLFNLPDVIALVRGIYGGEPYWRRVLEYCVDGCLQSVLDEYSHVLRDSLALSGGAESTAPELATAISSALGLRSATLSVDEITVDEQGARIEPFRMVTRFALPFGEDHLTASVGVRSERVRSAFNSPFWPFVLASTSVGQEGLDFHPYCHAIVHWNLPRNPVDMEQREGRVHRYKGHAVRKNVAKAWRDHLPGSAGDPWASLFSLAAEGVGGVGDELVPYWMYPLEDGAYIERHVPVLPLSRDQLFIDRMRKTLAIYRMAIGQPRQEDLVRALLSRMPEQELAALVDKLRIDLTPRSFE